MNEDSGDPAGPVLLSRAGTRSALVRAAVLLAVVTTVLVLWGWDAGLTYPILWLITVVISVLYVVVAHRAHAVVIDEEALVVRSPKGTTRYAWSGLLEVGWDSGYPPIARPGVFIRPKGGPWDTPGPYAPTQVATLAIFGRTANTRAREALRSACRRHGVAFEPKGLRMGPTPPTEVPQSKR